MATAAAQFYFGFQIGLRHSFLDISFYLQTKFCTYHSIRFRKKSAILEHYFRFHFLPYHRSRHVILHQFAKCEIISKSKCPQQTNDVMPIFKMSDLRHLGFYGFFEKSVYDLL